MTDIFDYSTSWLNPALKIIIVGIYILVAYTYYRARRYYAGDIEKILGTLFWMSTVAGIAALIRYFEHGLMFGFTPEYSLKWFQSLGYVVQAVIFVVVAWKLSKDIIPEVRD